MRILITGHTGLVGSNLMERLRDKYEVGGVSRSGFGGFDLLDKDRVREFISYYKPKVIYHLAANAAESRGQISPIDMTERNLNIMLNVLTPAIRNGLKRFVYASSVAVYGDSDVPYREDDTPRPKDVYGVNKYASEQIIKILSKVHGFDYTIFRPHNIYGPGQDMGAPYKNVVALFMRNIMENKPCTIFGGGKMRRAFSYVDDVVDIFEQALGPDFKDQTLNVGSSIEYGIKDLLHKIEQVAGKKANIIEKTARPQEIHAFIASHSKLNALTRYHETPIIRGLKQTWDYINLPDIKIEDDEIGKAVI